MFTFDLYFITWHNYGKMFQNLKHLQIPQIAQNIPKTFQEYSQREVGMFHWKVLEIW